jgi:hypothetical protein
MLVGIYMPLLFKKKIELNFRGHLWIPLFIVPMNYDPFAGIRKMPDAPFLTSQTGLRVMVYPWKAKSKPHTVKSRVPTRLV